MLLLQRYKTRCLTLYKIYAILSHMYKRHNNILKRSVNLTRYFSHPVSKRQRQYEAVRAFAIDNMDASEIARKYGYAVATVFTLIRNARRGTIELFPEINKGPKQRRTPKEIRDSILSLRSQNLSIADIQQSLEDNNISVS